MLRILKLVWGGVSVYRTWIMLAAAGGVLVSVLVFYGNCRSNATALRASQTELTDLRADLTAARNALSYQNERIRRDNERKLVELAAANRRANEAQAAVVLLRIERDKLGTELEITRSKLSETVENDKEFAIWASTPAPPDTWSLLQSASK